MVIIEPARGNNIVTVVLQRLRNIVNKIDWNWNVFIQTNRQEKILIDHGFRFLKRMFVALQTNLLSRRLTDWGRNKEDSLKEL